jgi:DNA-binding NarL/FixJ family response regulator
MNWRILLADDQVWVREGIRAVLRHLTDITICGEAFDGREAIEEAYKLHPDIVIADPWLPGANGLILTKRILERFPTQKVLMFGIVESHDMVRQLLRAGIKGLVFKTDPADDLVYAIEALKRNDLYFTPSIQTAILAEYLNNDYRPEESQESGNVLTLREQEVMQLLFEGRQTKEIADLLGISFPTAATHRTNLMRKLGIHNIAQLTLYAVSHGYAKVPAFIPLAEVIEMPRRELEKTAKAAA